MENIDEQYQRRLELLKKYEEFAERVRKMSDEEFLNTEIPDYMNIISPPFAIAEMARRGMIEGPVL